MADKTENTYPVPIVGCGPRGLVEIQVTDTYGKTVSGYMTVDRAREIAAKIIKVADDYEF